MIEIGSTLREIREGCSLSLKQLSTELKPYLTVSIDFLSKVENGYRNPTLQLIEGLSKVYELPSLIDFYYTVELHNQLSEHPNPKKLIRKVLKEWDNEPTFSDTSPKSITGLNNLKPIPKYIRGGKYGKVKGFDFYIGENERLQPKHRRILLDKCQNYMMNVPSDRINKLSLDNGELDKTHTDIEIVDMWNEFYNQWGHYFPEFKEKWEREFLPSKEEEMKQTKLNPTEVEPESKGSDLVRRFLKSKNTTSNLDF
jgi:transcriptional regulator with XRE-family HTH domain